MSGHGTYRRGNGSRAAAAQRSRRAPGSALSMEEARSRLAGRIRERLPELRAAVATRVHAISDPRNVADPAYLQSLDAAMRAAVDQRLAVLEAGEREAPPTPPVLLAQARLDARDGVPLDIVLRRYLAGNALFGDLLAEEAERAEVPNATLRHLLAGQTTFFERLLAAVGAEYARELENRPVNRAERRRECVKSLLAGELVDHSDLGYDLDAHHLALMAKGEGAQEAMRELAKGLDRRLLAVCREEGSTWACWLGGSQPLRSEEARAALDALVAPGRLFVTVGEPGEGLSGWRFSHRQAKAALPIAESRGRHVLSYVDVAVVASIARDDLVATSLRQLYLAPLERAKDGGEIARRTLRAYFACERNISSTASALGVDRRTVSNRLRAIEGRLGRPLSSSATDLETALRLDG